MLCIPEAEGVACDSGSDIGEEIIADSSPFTVVIDFQTSQSRTAAASQS